VPLVNNPAIAICSPGGVEHEREIVEQVLLGLKQSLRQRDCAVNLRRWEETARGYYRYGAQEAIVEHLRVEDCDLVSGIFGTRYGVIDDGGYSRTALALKRAIEAARKTGKPQVLVYFSREALSQAAICISGAFR
jgi:hypothetical protein